MSSKRLSRKEVRRLAEQGKIETDVHTPYHGSQNNVAHFPSKKEETLRKLEPKNNEQRKLMSALDNFPVCIATGKAGSGKTFIMAAHAIKHLLEGKVERLILIRPNQPLGKTIGMLPGSVWDKMLPWIAPYLDAFEFHASLNKIKSLVEMEKIQIVPVEFLRGRTFGSIHKTIVLTDEIQNLETEALKCLTERMGNSCQLFLSGDVAQSDLRGNTPLRAFLERLATYERSPVLHIELKECVRSRTAMFFSEFWES